MLVSVEHHIRKNLHQHLSSEVVVLAVQRKPGKVQTSNNAPHLLHHAVMKVPHRPLAKRVEKLIAWRHRRRIAGRVSDIEHRVIGVLAHSWVRVSVQLDGVEIWPLTAVRLPVFDLLVPPTPELVQPLTFGDVPPVQGTNKSKEGTNQNAA